MVWIHATTGSARCWCLMCPMGSYEPLDSFPAILCRIASNAGQTIQRSS